METENAVTKFGYVAKKPDANGEIGFSITENETWNSLYKRQISLIQTHAFSQYIEGVDALNINSNGVPRLSSLNKVLLSSTGWQLQPVECVISYDYFFDLLANKKFPAAAFIRKPEDLDFVPVPDIFHEIFGHCPLLLDPEYANFSHRIGKLGKEMPKQDQKYLARLYWFTIETGLIATGSEIKVYGGSTLSSYAEYKYATTSDLPLRLPFNLFDVVRMPYRVDVLPKVYFNITGFEQIAGLTEKKIKQAIKKAKLLGDFRSLYPVNQSDKSA